MTIEELIAANSGIFLDIACGSNKQEGYIGMDIQPLEGVDIVHDLNVHPWPLPDACVHRAIASHIIEHIPPVQLTDRGTRFPFIEFMDEVWRVMRVGGQFAIGCPHGSSQGFLQDPTHINALNETTFAYFDPFEPRSGGFLYHFYRPKPWKITNLFWTPVGNIEVVLVKRSLEELQAVVEEMEDNGSE